MLMADDTRALTVLERAALTQDSAVRLLRSALTADLDHLAVPACLVAVATNPALGELLSRSFLASRFPTRRLRASLRSAHIRPSRSLHLLLSYFNDWLTIPPTIASVPDG